MNTVLQRSLRCQFLYAWQRSGARQELLDISGAHIDSTIYIGPAGLEFAERLADLGAAVTVPTTLNVSGLDEHHWQEWAVPEVWAVNAQRQMVAYRRMGAVPTWTCAPYQTAWKPAFGQQVAWGESNAIVFANSVLGVRTNGIRICWTSAVPSRAGRRPLGSI